MDGKRYYDADFREFGERAPRKRKERIERFGTFKGGTQGKKMYR